MWPRRYRAGFSNRWWAKFSLGLQSAADNIGLLKNPPTNMINTIIDIYHGNAIDFAKAKQAGIVAIIHKATQGVTVRDSLYHDRRTQAKQLGFLWGSYHFSTGAPVADQVENYLSYAKPEDGELISLDWEPSDPPNMTLEQAETFVQTIKGETGRWPVVYGGSLLRESIGHSPDAVLSNCPLWYVRYAPSPIGIPPQVWPTYTLWQYTDGNDGPEPHATPGAPGADRNIFQGTTEQLKNAWPFTQRAKGVTPAAGFAHILKSSSPASRKSRKK